MTSDTRTQGICITVLVLLFVLSCGHSNQQSPSAGHSSTSLAEAPHWGYGPDDGPDSWASLSPVYATCGKGSQQSPIDIADASYGEQRNWQRKYSSIPVVIEHTEHVADIVDNGHTIQISGDKASTLVIEGKAYVLAQFHFHTPSEHKVNGRQYPMEMHLVHQSADGQFAVVGILIEEGAHNSNYDLLIENLPDAPGEKRHLENITVDIDDLLPEDDKAFSYEGSLTTPPCLEGVHWLVAQKAVQLSAAQLKQFSRRIHRNNRPVQPLNDRLINVVRGDIE